MKLFEFVQEGDRYRGIFVVRRKQLSVKLASIEMIEVGKRQIWEVQWLTPPLIQLNGGEAVTVIEGNLADLKTHVEDVLWTQLTLALIRGEAADEPKAQKRKT